MSIFTEIYPVDFIDFAVGAGTDVAYNMPAFPEGLELLIYIICDSVFLFLAKFHNILPFGGWPRCENSKKISCQGKCRMCLNEQLRVRVHYIIAHGKAQCESLPLLKNIVKNIIFQTGCPVLSGSYSSPSMEKSLSPSARQSSSLSPYTLPA